MLSQVSKEDWDDWKQYTVTKVFFEAVKATQDEAMQMLVKTVDMDSLTMAKFVGIMSGLQKVLEIEYDDRKESNER